MEFDRRIANWYRLNARNLPFRQTVNPYFIWLSEVILQQTRVEQGLNYYLKFISKYPTIVDLANADEMDVLSLWQGLGYYSRARNLHATAKIIKKEFGGIFPNNHSEIIKLKGIGEYTAAAISSFAFNLPFAVLDGNVYRVLSRVYNIDTAIDSSVGKKEFSELAQSLLNRKDPATHNQAIMEFGAIQCVPSNPNCEICPLNDVCLAFKLDKIKLLPYKAGKIKVRNRFLEYFYLTSNNAVFLKKRTEKDVWLHLYEFPMIENETKLEEAEMLDFIKTNFGNSPNSETYHTIHVLSHQKLHTRIWQIELLQDSIIQFDLSDFQRINKSDFSKFPISRLLERFLEELK